MTSSIQAVLRPRSDYANAMVRGFRHPFTSAVAALFFGLAGTSDPAAAQNASSLPPYVVGNDRGGVIKDRLRELRRLRLSGQPVEIRGAICYSTCTMLLGLPNTCISPRTQFGFHGPTLNGRRLPPDRFDYLSRVIAHYYPQPLKDWYLETGRVRLKKIYRISGANIIRMGIRSCETDHS